MEFVIPENLQVRVRQIVILLPHHHAVLRLLVLTNQFVLHPAGIGITVDVGVLRKQPVEQAQCSRFGINCSGFNFLFAGTH